MDRKRVGLAALVTLCALALAGFAYVDGQPMVCGPEGCHRPGSRELGAALQVVAIVAFPAAGWLAVRAFQPSTSELRLWLGAAASLAIVAFASGMGHSSSCYGDSRSGMTCDETIPLWRVNLAFGLAIGAVAAACGALASRLAAAPAGTPLRMRNLRLGFAILAACLLVPALLALRTPPGVPDGVEWQLEGRDLCARWSYPGGAGGSCRPLASVFATPLMIAAGVAAGLQAGRPRWRWPGWLAVASGVAGIGVIVALNTGNPGKTTWYGLALLTAGLALGCWLLEKERSRA